MIGALVEPRVAGLGFKRQETVRAGPYLRGDSRIDPAPQSNRTSNAILVSGYTADKTRQMFVVRLRQWGSGVLVKNELTVRTYSLR